MDSEEILVGKIGNESDLKVQLIFVKYDTN